MLDPKTNPHLYSSYESDSRTILSGLISENQLPLYKGDYFEAFLLFNPP